MGKSYGNFNINNNKVDRTKDFEGKTGIFTGFSFTILESPDKFGNNLLIFQSETKEERQSREEKGEKAPIVGSGKIYFKNK